MSCLIFYVPLLRQLMRSIVPAQSICGMRILAGSLERRELLVALEAYGSGCLGLISGEIEQRALYHFYSGFDEMLNQFQNTILQNVTQESLQGAVSDNFSFEIRMRRLFIFASLRLVAPDFPVELAYLVHKESITHYRSMSSKRMGLELLKSYLLSPMEEAIAVKLHHTGIFSAYGSPCFMMPQARRSELPYSERVLNCLEKNALSCQDIDDQDASGHKLYSVIDIYALRFRWFRLNAILSEDFDGNTCELLFFNVQRAYDSCALIRSLTSTPNRALAANSLPSFRTEWGPVIETAIVSLEILAAATRSVHFKSRGVSYSNVGDIQQTRLVTQFMNNYTKLGSMFMDGVLMDQLFDLYCIAEVEIKEDFGKLLLRCCRLSSLWWRLVAATVDIVGVKIGCFVGKDQLGNALLDYVYTITAKHLRSLHTFHQFDDYCLGVEVILMSALRIWRSALCCGCGIGLVHDLLKLTVSDEIAQHDCLPCNDPKLSLMYLVMRLIGASSNCIMYFESNSSFIIAVFGIFEQAVHVCAAAWTSWENILQRDERMKFCDVLDVDLEISQKFSSDMGLISSLSRRFLKIAGELIDFYHSIGNTHGDFGCMCDSLRMNGSLESFLASVFGIFHSSTISVDDRPSSVQMLGRSLSGVSRIGVGLCAAIISVEPDTRLLLERGFSKDYLAVRQDVEKLVKSPFIVKQIQYFPPAMESLKTLLRAPTAFSIVRNVHEPCLEDNKNSLDKVNRIITLLRSFRVYLGLRVRYFESIDVPWSVLIVGLRDLLMHLMIKLRGALSMKDSPVRGFYIDAESFGLISWRVSFLQQIALLEILGILGVCAEQCTNCPILPSNWLISIIFSCVPLFCGPLKTVSLNLAMIIWSHVLEKDTKSSSMCKSMIGVLLMQGIPVSLRLNYTTVLTDKAIIEDLLNASIVLTGNVQFSSEGAALWFQRSFLFGNMRNDKQTTPWLYDITSKLHGADLQRWLTVLAELNNTWQLSITNVSSAPLESRRASGTECGIISKIAPDGSNAVNLGHILFSLVELTLPSNSNKWMDSQDTAVPEAALNSYVELLRCKVVQLLNSDTFTKRCSAQIMERAHSTFQVLRHGNSKDCSVEDLCLGSSLELISQLLDASFSSHIDHRIHASALAIFLLPSVGVRYLQQTIWLKFGEHRLIHLLGLSSLFADCAVCFLPLEIADVDINVINAIIFALGRLRDQSDMLLPVCRLGILRIAQYIFCGEVIEGRRLFMLRGIFSATSPEQECWYSSLFIELFIGTASKMFNLQNFFHGCKTRNDKYSYSNVKLCSSELLSFVESIGRRNIQSFARSVQVRLLNDPVADGEISSCTLYDVLCLHRPEF